MHKHGSRWAGVEAARVASSRDRKVSFFGETFKTYGEPTQGIEHLIPLAWNKKVKVERYG